MVFSSLPFVYFFLPCILILYYVVPTIKLRNYVLLAFSIVFYSWGEPKNIVLLLLSTFVAYVGGCAVNKFDITGNHCLKKLSFVVTLILVSLNLFIFKYLGFVVENINILISGSITVRDIVLPIGISFYTFQLLSYIIDLYCGKVQLQRNFFWLLLYVSFFPQLIAGPIVRYKTIEAEISGRKESLDEVSQGLRRFIVGLGKKLILANYIGSIAETIYAGDVSVFGTAAYWIAAWAYTLQIYFDFSAYSDMAIGLGKMFGFHFLENFDYPYISLSVTEFWRRWHISLSSWFRDYIYIPLGGNRVDKKRWIFNILAVWSLTGLWHGAQWNFVLWGLYYGVLLLLEKLFLARFIESVPRYIRWLFTMFFVVIGWVIFNLTDGEQLMWAFRTMFTLQPTDWLAILQQHAPLVIAFVLIPLGIVCMLPVKRLFRVGEGLAAEIVSYALHGALLIACIVIMVSSSYNPFIYFRF